MFGSGESDGGMFGSRDMEQSFREFVNRPENRPKLEAHQRKEMMKNMKQMEAARMDVFKEKVLSSEYESQKNIAPFLKYRPLRRVIQTLTNDPMNDFDVWASNPQVIQLLQNAKQVLDEGRMSEDEMEQLMLAQFKDPSHPAHADFKASTQHVARLGTEQLVQALNEHLQERQKGNEAYRQSDAKTAMHHYERALSILNVVQGVSASDQSEVLRNKQIVLRNIAAVHLFSGHHGAAVKCCTEALEVSGGKDVKALLRRAKAYLGRHEYQLAEDDLNVVKSLEPWNAEAVEVTLQISRKKAKRTAKEKDVCAGMFSAEK